MNIRNYAVIRAFYKDKIEGGAHDNLRRRILQALRDMNVRARRYLDIGCADGSFTLKVAIGDRNSFIEAFSR